MYPRTYNFDNMSKEKTPYFNLCLIACGYLFWILDAGMSAEVTVKGVVSAAGEEWRNMSAEQKKPYEKRSVEAGKKYEQDMAEYRKVSSCVNMSRLSCMRARLWVCARASLLYF